MFVISQLGLLILLMAPTACYANCHGNWIVGTVAPAQSIRFVPKQAEVNVDQRQPNANLCIFWYVRKYSRNLVLFQTGRDDSLDTLYRHLLLSHSNNA